MNDIIKIRYDKDGEEYYSKDIVLKLEAFTYEKENLQDIENMIFEVLNDKSFDNIAWFKWADKDD